MKAVESRFSNFDSPANPAAKYRRGQTIKVKYQRNNHGPGGFVRHTLVPINQMMNKAAHSRNAFHYSCFGARPVPATVSDRKMDHFGYSIAGTDGKRSAPGYYESRVTIPDVVPDGDYVFGWVWYGGTGGEVSNQWPYKHEPWWKGYFSDYWSCSYVRIEGGNPIRASYTPVFENDMKMFSEEGCMSANDAPGICEREPCIVPGEYQKPKPFKNGSVPDALTPSLFGGSAIQPRQETMEPNPTPPPPTNTDVSNANGATDNSEGMRERPEGKHRLIMQRRSCRCIGLGTKCGKRIARRTGSSCKSRISSADQPRKCKQDCCAMCRVDSERTSKFCRNMYVRQVCRLQE